MISQPEILIQTSDFDTPFVVFCKDRIRENISMLRQLPVDISFAVKSNYSRTCLHEIAPLVDSFDVQSVWEASLVPAGSQIRFHSPLLDKKILSVEGLKQVTANSLAQAAILEGAAPTLRWGCRVTLPEVEANQFISSSDKFGIRSDALPEILSRALYEGRPCRYLHHHSTSRLSDSGTARRLSVELCDLLSQLPESAVAEMDEVCVGGGLEGAGELRTNMCSVVDLMSEILLPIQQRFPHLRVVVEPGRYVVEDSCIVITTVNEVRSGSAGLVAVVDISTGFLIPLAAARFRLAGTVIGKVRQVTLVDASCSPNGVILRVETNIDITAGSRLIVENCGAYTFSCSGPYLHQMPPLLVLDGQTLTCATDRAHLERISREILY
jgi:diaminopimelate decarboxylase